MIDALLEEAIPPIALAHMISFSKSTEWYKQVFCSFWIFDKYVVWIVAAKWNAILKLYRTEMRQCMIHVELQYILSRLDYTYLLCATYLLMPDNILVEECSNSLSPNIILIAQHIMVTELCVAHYWIHTV